MNSRPGVSNQDELTRMVEKLGKNASERGTRALMVLFTPPSPWLENLAIRLNCQYLEARSDTDRADRISALLGSERNTAVVQIGRKPDLGLLAAISGTLQAGGVLVLGTTEQAPHNTIRGNDHTVAGTTRSIRRLEALAVNLARQYPETIWCLNVAPIQEPGPLASPSDDNQVRQTVLSGPRQDKVLNPDALAEQNSMVEQACKHLSENTASLIMITGRRGRGKSTLLARIAMHLENIQASFQITALHESALSSFVNHAAPSSCRFLSPESAAVSKTDILLVDEAASFSLNQLQRYAVNCHHLILCSTTEGYEASGRALDVRLKSDLHRPDMKLLHLQPTCPWRWCGDDPLEQFTDQLLLTDLAKNIQPIAITNYAIPADAAENCHVKQITQDQLVQDERLLADVQGLLSATHYQTTTKDLEHLLDAPTLELWVQTLEHRVVGVLLLETEGQIPQSLHSAILAKRRRIPNQLLPQLLAQMADDSHALQMRYGRVVRLSIAPQLRRLGLASSLVEALVQAQASATHGYPATPACRFDAIGASFASDPCSQAFWQSMGFCEFHRGFRANPRTGKQAVTVLRCFESQTENVLMQALHIHQDNQRARGYKQFELNNRVSSIGAIERDIRLLERFAIAQRSVNDTYAALQRLATMVDLPLEKKSDSSTKQYELELRASVKRSLPAYRAAVEHDQHNM